MEDRLLSLKWSNYKIQFFENLKILRENTNYADATLAVEGKFYPVHKVVMSTCSEYFSDIFERTPCKSPVIVLKDVPSHDIESLLDYMYLGEVRVHQNDLASLLKTAECLRIKGLALPDEDTTNIHKSSTSSNDDAGQGSPPPKRQRCDSKIIHQRAASPVLFLQKTSSILVNQAAQTSSMPPYSTSNTEHDESPVVEVKVEDAESPVMEVKIEDSANQDERFRRENNYKGGARSDQDPLGNYRSDLSNAQYEPENDGSTSFPGPSLQQSDIFSMEGVMPKIMNVRTDTNPFKTNENLSDSSINQNQTDNPNESVFVSSVKVNRVDKPKVSYKPIEQNQVYKGAANVGSANLYKQISNVLQSTSAGVPAVVVAAVNNKGSPVYIKICGDQAIRMVKFMNPKKGKVGMIKVMHCGQVYTVLSNALRVTHNIPGIPDGSSPNYTVHSNALRVTHNILGIPDGSSPN